MRFTLYMITKVLASLAILAFVLLLGFIYLLGREPKSPAVDPYFAACQVVFPTGECLKVWREQRIEQEKGK